jgi:hypothetical protein
LSSGHSADASISTLSQEHSSILSLVINRV